MANFPSETAKRTNRRRVGVRGGRKVVRVTRKKSQADLLENTLLMIRDRLKSYTEGDFSTRIPETDDPLLSEIVYQLNILFIRGEAITKEFSRISREVAEEGKLTAYASVENVAGAWRHNLDSVNTIVRELARPIKEVSRVMRSVAAGDLTQKINIDATGEIRDLKETINTMVDQLNSFAAEVTRVAKEVGTEGKLGGQADVKGVSGTWRDLTENVNQLAGNLTNQVRNIALVTTAVAKGDLSQKITVSAQGEILQLKDTINTMVDQLRGFAAEVTRVAREVGTEGKLGGQAQVPGVAGIWKDLTDNVNTMASNLTSQVRGIAKVVTAVAEGDLNQKLLFGAKGEIAELADTINAMTDTLRVFADQVTSVAREVGIEGKLGGQANVPGASGTWRDLTDNVNQLAGNLTTQVRAIADVVTAVARGDLTPSISVEAQGEVLDLKDNINQMIKNLRDTTSAAKEQDWLKTNLARFSSMMQGQRSIMALAKLIMNELTPVLSAQYGVFYILEGEGSDARLKLLSSYAHTIRKNISNVFRLGEGLVGQAALEKKMIVVTNVPDDYIHIVSGLGEAPPKCIVVLPILFEGQLKAVIELASFQDFSRIHLSFLEQLAQSIGVVFNMISASMRTEELLQELQKSNAELEGRSQELERRSQELEIKNHEIAQASASLEEKARELSQISKYKSDFLANMSHELRTPLNSLLILAKMLADNDSGNLTPRQVEFARTIYGAGNDLLSLINEILDLSKIEAGKITVEFAEVPLTKLVESLDKNFRQMALEKNLEFQIQVDHEVPRTIFTDGQRLNQILRNLLANAFKFTERGAVHFRIYMADPNKSYKTRELNKAKRVIAFEVADTGVGIPKDKQESIFEAFQQADTTISKRYGGTGLGLTISQNLVKLLGGELGLTSEVGVGSVFTLYMPLSESEESHDTRGGVLSISAPSKLQEPVRARSLPVQKEPIAEKRSGGEESAANSLAGRRILVVDDDARSRYAMSKLFESRGMIVSTVDGGEECINYLKTHRNCDLVLLDVVLPTIDGFTVAHKIKTDESLSKIPVITFSAKSIPYGRERALAAGCADYIESVSDPEAVLGSMRRVFEDEESPPKSPSNSLDAREKSLEGRKILLIDDDPRNLFAMASFLESQGAEVVAAAHADEGISALKQNSGIEVVLMDIMLPDIDGYEATRMIRKMEEFKNIPIIAVTAKAMAEDRKRAENAGCTDFVPKPVVNERLLKTVLKHLPRQATTVRTV